MAPSTQLLHEASIAGVQSAFNSPSRSVAGNKTVTSSLIVSWAISGKNVVVIGGDNVAASRAVFAVEAGANVTVVAPFNTLSPSLKQVLSNGSIQWADRSFDSSDLNNATMVFVCSDASVSAALARQIGVLAREKKVPVNVASASDLSDFYFMSTYKDQSLQVAISTNGNGPRLASKLRKQIVNSIPSHAGAALETLAKLRQLLKQADPSTASNQRRLNFVNRVSETWAVETLAALNDAEIAALVHAYTTQALDLPRIKQGTIRVIRAGSGLIDDLTVGAYRALSEAELVLSDASVPKELLDLVTGDLMVIPADSEKPSDSMLHAALRALELGQNVIRLKKGSEFVNVEQDDELAVFNQKGFKAVVVPCVSAAVAVSASVTTPVKSVIYEQEAPVSIAREVQFSPVVLPTVQVAPTPVSSVRAAGSPQLISGQDAAAHVAYALSDLSFVYPVVPQSTIGKSVAEWSAAGVKNANGKFHKTTQVETRTGAGAIVHGAAHGGSAVSVLANSAALSHMLPSLYQIAADKLPVVIHAATQGVNKDFGVYSSVADVVATSFTGFASIGSSNVKESHDLALVAHVAATVTKTPFIHFYDGARIATEKSVAPIIATSALGQVVKNAVSQASAISSVPVADLVESVMNNLAGQLGHHYKLFEYSGASSAETIIVALGTSANVAEEAVSQLSATGKSVGLLKIRLLRPWSARHFLAALPRTVKKIVLIDDSKVEGSSAHGALFLDVTSAFYDSVWSLPIPTIFKGTFAAGVENFNAAAVQFFLNSLGGADAKFDFKIQAPASAAHSYRADVFEAIVWDQQADETENIAPRAVKLLESQGASSVQIFTTTSSVNVEPISATHIRFSKNGVVAQQSPSLVSAANFVAVHNLSLLESFNVATSIREGGLLLLNRSGANPTVTDVAKDIPDAIKRQLHARKARVAVVDADKIAFNYTQFRGHRGEYRNLALLAVLAKLWDGVDGAQAVRELEAGLSATETDNTVYRTKLGALRTALSTVTVFSAPSEWGFALLGAELPKYFQPTFGLKKLTGLDEEELEVVGKAVAKYEPALPILFKEAFALKSSLRPDAGEKTFTVHVTSNTRLTPDTYERNVFHIEFDIGSSGLKYDIGEALGVYGQNNPDHVEEFLQWYGAEGSQVIRYDRVNEKTGTTETEYRTVSQLFTEAIDIFGKPGKKFFQTLIEHATNMEERERLGFLASGEGADELAKLQEEETVTFADVLQMFPSAHPSVEKLLAAIPNIKPRHYSISSSMNVHRTSVHLLVVVVDWKTKSGKVRMGQCTRYLVGLRPGTAVTVSVKPSVMKLPPSHEAPVIMAGLGTGMAPFRAFVEERAYQKSLGHKVGPMVLYFGARHRAEEYLYGEELEAYHFDGLLTHLRLAFSRDQKEKVYIQHKIKADDTMLGDMILKQGGAFYLCGPTWPVPDIRDALISSFSKFMTVEEATEKLESLKEEERYVLEVY
ncbi:UNVERIFIED_CONTAM: hypothetical protein HDU68_008227 [Siphonaria sp. JEL0065]|nr:hypothetical protein HDU68_008227 [Siphonaria sp. JEL0065]